VEGATLLVDERLITCVEGATLLVDERLITCVEGATLLVGERPAVQVSMMFEKKTVPK
jgi:hypothetical protein